MTNSLERLTRRRDAMLADLRRFVECESPSAELEQVRQMAELVTATAGALALPNSVTEVNGRPTVLVGTGEEPVLMLAHLDTVHSLGADYNPWRIQGGRAFGLGVFDMKSGIVIGLHALAELPAGSAALLIDSDEEIGSEASVELIERTAAGKRAVLVLEPSLDGALKTARKGVSNYRLEFHGRAAHAGLEPEKGRNALVGLAESVLTLRELADPERGTTVTPTVAAAGTVANVVPERAELVVDVRATTLREQQRVDERIRTLAPGMAGVTVTVQPGPQRPPLEPAASAELFARAARVAADLGLPPLRGAAAGGGSDGNFTAALGIPTLDGLGAVGAGAHSTNEWVEIDSLPERAALVAGLVEDLLG